jgi:type IV pilus assembly protein PilA
MLSTLRKRLNAKDESGFTLIELLVVLIIIGVLLAIAVPSYLGFKDKAQQTAAAANVREAEPSAEAYYSDNNTYVGITTTKMLAYDSGLAQGLVVFGSASGFCISDQNGTHFAKTVGPGGSVYTDASPSPNTVSANCASATG